MKQIINTIGLFRPLITSIISDLWALIKTQGLSFILIVAFSFYQLQINRDLNRKIAELQYDLFTYLTVDKKELNNTVLKNTEVIEDNNKVLENIKNLLEKKK